jgi:hypothetical protein
VLRRRKPSSTWTIASILRRARCRAIVSRRLDCRPYRRYQWPRLRLCTRWAGEAAIRPRPHSAAA